MADTNETIADIAAEKRRIAKEIRDYASNGDYWDKKRANETAEDLEEEADRIEAAHKRERGDCAKLREALKLCVDEMCDRCRESAAARGNPLPCLSGCEPVRKAKSALSAPPRNCDLPEVAKDPWRAWLDDKSNWDEFGSPELEIHDWLLAPATEKEGGAK